MISSNYYPVTSAISIEDINSDRVFTIMNDRTQGGSADPWDKKREG